MAQHEIGMIGLGVMGRNLLLNMADHGFPVAGFDLDAAKVEALRKESAGRSVHAAGSIEELVRALRPPRAIVLLVPAGPPVDQVIRGLVPLLQPGDILIDGGNSHFTDTERRADALAARGISLLGVGISGGEAGARHGPCIMPGGPADAYAAVRKIFETVAAQADGPCCAYIGPRGAGHYVKMVHNGIEYAMLQCIAEIYDVLSTVLGLEAAEVSRIFARWNQGELGGYLVEIAALCLSRVDPDTRRPLVDLILDKAGQKGTGKWTSQSALDLGVPTPTIDLAVACRVLSDLKEERVAASKVIRGPRVRAPARKAALAAACRDALHVANAVCYAQGLALARAASKAYGYDLKLDEIARIWRGGCIIRSKLLGPIAAAYKKKPALPNLLVDKFFARLVSTRARALRTVVSEAARAGVPVLGLAGSLGYLDSYRRARLPQNLTQAQRDFFGAHTYQRIDKQGNFHTNWTQST